MRYGKWTVLDETRVVSQKTEVLCRCECGFEKFVRTGNLRSGQSTCCRSCSRTVHGAHKTPEYQAYHDAKTRCENPKHRCYADYGGRGIKFLFSSWEEFIGHIGPRTNGMSLDRIDNEGNYEPGNVRWAKQETQQNNKRTNLFVTYRGQRKTVAQWARVLGAPKTTLLNRVHSGLPFMP